MNECQRRLAGAFRAGALRAGAFFLAGAFLAAGAFFLAGAFFAAVFAAGGHTPDASLGAADGDITASLKPFRGVMRAFFEALMRMASPVAGLRPMRALESRRTNLANPEITTGSPLAATAVTTSVNPVRMASTSLLFCPVWAA